MSHRVTVEICAEGVRSALAAAKGGADRIELCENVAAGGVTPSAGAISVVCREAAVPIHVLIRPRTGDFVYSHVEFDAMRKDIELAVSLGARGVVLGVLRHDGTLDLDRTCQLVRAARPLAVTFHKAIDLCPDPLATIDQLIELGVDRILSSGQSMTARKGLDRLGLLQRHAAGRIGVMAGGGISDSDIPMLLAAGLHELHVGSAVQLNGVTSAGRVREVCQLARDGGDYIP